MLSLLATGDQQAFTAIFGRYWDKIYSTSLTLTKSVELAQDISQEVFLKLWKDHPVAAEIRDLDSFLFISCRNLIYNKFQRTKVEDAYRFYLKSHPETQEDTGVGLREMQGLVESGISRLPPQQQRAFRLSREQGLNHEEIALQMGVSKATVKDYIVRAIAFLRKFLQDEVPLLVLLIYGLI